MAPGGEVNPAEQGAELVCVATVLHVRGWWHLLPFLRMSRRVFGQLSGTPGLVRWSVKAELLTRLFYTFTVWKDRSSMATFTTIEPHATAMKSIIASGGPKTAFVEWVSLDGSINWDDAKRRLRQEGQTMKP